MSGLKRLFAVLLLAIAIGLPVLAVAAPVNINTADAATLAAGLQGVGPAKAEAIIAYRDANGPFKQADDLLNVKGIGQKTLEQNRESIVFE